MLVLGLQAVAAGALVDGWADALGLAVLVCASRAALVLPGVDAAEVQITGSPSAPVLHVDCAVRGADALDRVTERVTLSIVQSLEELIGVGFAERHITVRHVQLAC